jgi:hypothetical protein
MPSLVQRAGSRVSLLIAVLVLTFAVLASVATATAGRADSGTVWASVTHVEGSIIWVAGDFKDKILGRGAIIYQTTASGTPTGSVTVTAKTITLYTKRGTLTGSGYATQTADANGNVTVTNGHATLKRGTGALAGHSIVVTFSGPQKDGVYTFTYKGTYK